ncbi:MAG: hypothetical protein EAX81_05925 [Candidatus Thorarchaeota archaeon]|nr:hypothetical protein [Candidatus Thorarchaeota archaeon]
MDAWSDGDYSTYDHVDGSVIYHVPMEHSDFNGDEAGYTTFTSCEQKGWAFWWMVAMLAGWNAQTPTTTMAITSSTGAASITTTSRNLDMNLIPISIGGIVTIMIVSAIL